MKYHHAADLIVGEANPGSWSRNVSLSRCRRRMAVLSANQVDCPRAEKGSYLVLLSRNHWPSFTATMSGVAERIVLLRLGRNCLPEWLADLS